MSSNERCYMTYMYIQMTSTALARTQSAFHTGNNWQAVISERLFWDRELKKNTRLYPEENDMY